MDTNHISQYLKQLRLKKQWTQQMVADHLHITPQAVSKWERGESLPDILLLPVVAALYEVPVADILSVGLPTQETAMDFQQITQVLNHFIDDNVFRRIVATLEKAKHVTELGDPIGILVALNSVQRERIVKLLLLLQGYECLLDEVMPFLSMTQRDTWIYRLALDGFYTELERCLPYMSRTLRTTIVKLLLERGHFSFLEEMIVFLNHEQKDTIIAYYIERELDRAPLEAMFPFFSKTQLKKIEKKD